MSPNDDVQHLQHCEEFDARQRFGNGRTGPQILRPLLDRLAAMYALEYSDPSDLNQAEIIATESADGQPDLWHQY